MVNARGGESVRRHKNMLALVTLDVVVPLLVWVCGPPMATSEGLHLT